MKRDTSITKEFGITQLEAAMIFGVHPSQWSMYSSGKRELPAHAMQMLAALSAYVIAPERVNNFSKESSHKQMRGQLEQLLAENELQTRRIAHKIRVTLKKQESARKMLLLSEFLESHSGKHTFPGVKEIVANKTSQSLETLTALLIQQEHRQELLVAEKELLESKLKELK